MKSCLLGVDGDHLEIRLIDKRHFGEIFAPPRKLTNP
jgi:hypothetical protein